MKLNYYFRLLKKDLTVEEAVESLVKGTTPTQNTACGRLEWMAEDNIISEKYIPDFKNVLFKSKNQQIICSLVKILVLIHSKDSISVVDKYVSQLAKTTLVGTRWEKLASLGNLGFILKYLVRDSIAYHTASFLLLYLVITENVNDGRKVTSYRHLRNLNPDIIKIIDPEVRDLFDKTPDLFDLSKSIIKSSTKVVLDVTIKLMTEDITGGNAFLSPLIENSVKKLVNSLKPYEVKGFNLSLGDGKVINVPNIENIPDDILSNFLKDYIFSLAEMKYSYENT